MSDIMDRIRARREELRQADPMAGLQDRIAKRRAELASTAQGEVIATTQDGGRVVRSPSGTLSFTSPNYSTNDPAAIERLMAGEGVKRVVQSTTDQMTIAQAPVAARVQEFNQGAPIIGEWLDEAVGAISPTAGRAMDQVSDAFERERPGQSLALNVAGGIAYTAPFLAGKGFKAVTDFVGRGRGVLSKGMRAGLAAAPAGAIEGASSFAGRAEDGQRLQQAGIGAAVGGGMATALGPVAALVGVGVADLAKRFKRMDVATIADEFGVDKAAARVIKRQLANDDLDAAIATIQRGGPDAMLADAGPATRQALDSAMATGGEALSTARTRVSERTAAAGTRLTQTLDDVLGAPEGVRSATQRIAQRTSAQRAAAYDFAYRQPTPMTGAAAEAIDAALARIDPTTMEAALREANAEMLNSGYRNMNIVAQIADDGTVTFSQPLSVLQLDYIARGLGNVAEKGTDTVTGYADRGAQRAMSLAKALRDAMKQSVPGYSRALKLGGDAIAEREALMLGRDLFKPSVTMETVVTTMRGASDEAKAAARQGLRQNIDAIMGRARATLGDIEAGTFDFETGQDAAREALAAVRAMSSRDNFRKARVVLGKDADRVFGELQRTADALALRAAVARGSATAIRTAGREQMAAEATPGLLRRTAGEMGNPLDAMREISRTVAGTDAGTTSQINQEVAAQIADALTRIRGPEAERALMAVQAAMRGQPLKDADAALIGRLVGGGAGLAMYQTGERLTAPRPQ